MSVLSATTYRGVRVDESLMRCLECDRSFSSLGGLRRHAAGPRHKNGSSQCDVCGKRFDTPTGARMHMRVHNIELNEHGERSDGPFVCSVCGREFTSLRGLGSHIRYHDPNYREWRRGLHFGRQMSAESKEKMRQTQLRKYSDPEFSKRMADSKRTVASRARYSAARRRVIDGYDDQRLIDLSRMAMGNLVRTMSGDSRGHRSVHHSQKAGDIHCDSDLELRFCRDLDGFDNVFAYGRCDDCIVYSFDGRRHVYNPDFCVQTDEGTVIVEIKGADSDQVRAKMDAAVEYYRRLGLEYVLMFEGDIERCEERGRFMYGGGGADEADCKD